MAGNALAAIIARSVIALVSVFMIRRRGFPFVHARKDLRFGHVVMDVARVALP